MHHIAKSIAVIGSTGSIGTQTLDIVSRYPDRYRIALLAAGSNVDALVEQCRQFRPSMAVIADPNGYTRLREALEPLGIETAAGPEALADAMERPDFDMVVTATVGYSGLFPTIRALQSGKDIALANKETLVVAGSMITRLAAQHGCRLFPVDSEHSAIAQCLAGEDSANISRLIITASGGPFRNLSADRLSRVTPQEALRHPNWSMGPKITIDSATMINKAFEIIEARWLFDIPVDRIVPVVHPQSIVHSMVEFVDGAIKAQLGVPDMHLPIAYALGELERLPGVSQQLRLEQMAQLTFELPDYNRFPCLGLASIALERGGTAPCAINAANEVANASFRCGELPFDRIYPVIMSTLESLPHIDNPAPEDFVSIDTQARALARKLTKAPVAAI